MSANAAVAFEACAGVGDCVCAAVAFEACARVTCSQRLCALAVAVVDQIARYVRLFAEAGRPNVRPLSSSPPPLSPLAQSNVSRFRQPSAHWKYVVCPNDFRETADAALAACLGLAAQCTLTARSISSKPPPPNNAAVRSGACSRSPGAPATAWGCWVCVVRCAALVCALQLPPAGARSIHAHSLVVDEAQVTRLFSLPRASP